MKLDDGCQVCFNAVLSVTAEPLFKKLLISSQPRCEKGFMEGEAAAPARIGEVHK